MTDDLPMPVEMVEEELALFEEANPRSLINIVPPAVKSAIKAVPRELAFMDETELKKMVKPSPSLNYARLNFWLEYNRAQERRKPMNMVAVIRGACTKDYFFEKILNTPEMLAWVILPPADYTLIQADILYSGLDRLREILKLPLYTVTTKTDPSGVKVKKKVVNVGVLQEIRRVVEFLSDRVQGAVIQKLAVKSQSHSTFDGNLRTNPQGTYEPDALDNLNKTLGGIQKQLAGIEAEAGLPYVKHEASEPVILEAMNEDTIDLTPEDLIES